MASADAHGSGPTPTVTIGMPVYNDATYLPKALDDIVGQSFEDFELIISDNGSTDESPEICQRYAERDSRIRYVRQPENLGQQRNFMFLLRQARGEFFMWAASDDRWHRDFVSTLVDALRADDSLASAFCPFVFIDEEDNTVSEPQDFDYSGATVLERVSKFCFHYSDAFFYALHRTRLIQDVEIPIWWGPNANIPLNCGYPMLTTFLSRGGFVSVGGPPMWFNRLHTAARHSDDFRERPVVEYLAEVLRKANVLYESARAVQRGSGSTPVMVSTLPVLSVRFVADCTKRPRSMATYALKRLKGRR